MTTYTAHFMSSNASAAVEFDADTPEQALRQARALMADNPTALDWDRFDISTDIEEIEILDPRSSSIAFWQTDTARLLSAARDLFEAGEAVISAWEHGDLAAAVRALDTAISKAKGG